MAEVNGMVLTGYSINCDRESLYALESNGARANRVHVNDLINGKDIRGNRVSLEDYQILIFPGGFSYGDYISAGKGMANKVMNNLRNEVLDFIREGKLVMGFCNGFQIMIKAGLVPGFDGNYEKQVATLTNNNSGKYEDRWIYLKKEKNSKCIFTKGIEDISKFGNGQTSDVLYLPVAHGEGKFVAKPEDIKRLEDGGQIVFRYSHEDGTIAGEDEYPVNPNGSLESIAGICDSTGKVFAMMPHPERFLNASNHPFYTRIKDQCRREGKPIPKLGDGNIIFKNAIEYAKANLI